MTVVSMTNDLPRPETVTRNPEGGPRFAPDRASCAALIADLESLRNLVTDRLGSIEKLARDKMLDTRELTALRESLDKQSAQVEENRRRLRDEAERQQEEWETLLSRLEGDRRLLAEAWERIEHERVETTGVREENRGTPAPQSSPANGSLRGQPHAASPSPIRSAAGPADAYNPVAQAILQQFQTLCSDVRHSANARRAAR
jgi:hypothetical protein